MRLNKFLAKAGLGSRRECDFFIQKGYISINGNIVNDFSYQVKDIDHVKFKKKTINIIDEDYVYILNKPLNYICSAKDELNRKKVLDLFPSDIRLFTVGRLDYKTTGAILLTNNGDLADSILRPNRKIERIYYVETSSKLNKENINNIKKGLRIKNQTLKANINFKTKIKNNYIWSVILYEGKYREIHRIFEFFNIKVLKLHRYRFAGITSDNLKPGKFRRLKKKEIETLKKLTKK